MAFDVFDVVRVPFPFTDREASKNRPALVLSDGMTFNAPAGHSVMAMITSADNPPWPEDCLIGDLATAGLPAPSKVRFKLFTLDHRLVRGVLGHLGPVDAESVRAAFAAVFAGAITPGAYRLQLHQAPPKLSASFECGQVSSFTFHP